MEVGAENMNWINVVKDWKSCNNVHLQLIPLVVDSHRVTRQPELSAHINHQQVNNVQQCKEYLTYFTEENAVDLHSVCTVP
jgi:hypothetical protein